MFLFGHNKKLILLLLPILSIPAVPADQSSKPVISIIIDDLGYRYQDDVRALELPGPVAYAILPHAPYTKKISELAATKNKDVLLHQPMQAIQKNNLLGPGALTVNMTRDEFTKIVNINIRAVPNLIGINNHMGSLLTRYPEQMQWLMEIIKDNKKFYVDSLTSDASLAAEIAGKNNIPYLSRDVFLDNNHDGEYIHEQFNKLIDKAKQKGTALGIGHSHPKTIETLSRLLQDLEQYGVEIIDLKSLLTKQRNGRHYAKSPGSTRTRL